ncbi:centromere protein M [Clupea harengus]|uniref:Centromere protein M n=1 Tax=Clupea harengus TaxID=7950 RepID=A0A6P8EU98_CLUHA|nr:centromere protein M [Clupea harengus]
MKLRTKMLKPFRKVPVLNAANVLLVENEEHLHSRLADIIVQNEKDVNITVRLARKLPLPVENQDSRPRIDLVVFIVNLMSERSVQSAEQSVRYLDSGFFLGKVCFLVTGARCLSVSSTRLLTVRKMASSLHCPLLFAEDQTSEGVIAAAVRLLGILKVAAGLVPFATGLSLNSVTHCILPSDLEQNLDSPTC